MESIDHGRSYRHVLLIESRDWWQSCKALFDPERDLVLTYDFGLLTDVKYSKGVAFYVDHLVDNLIMEKNNFLVYQFFRDWFRDSKGRDIFEYRGIPFGNSLRIEIWNDLIFYVRSRLCLESLLALKFEALYVGTHIGVVEAILTEMKVPFTPVHPSKGKNTAIYLFPIHQWTDEKLRYRGLAGLKYRIRDLASSLQGSLLSWVDRLQSRQRKRPTIFVQEYHPTRRLVQRLQQDAKVRLVLATFSRHPGWFRYIPTWGFTRRHKSDALDLMNAFRASRSTKLIISSGTNVTNAAYELIDKRVASRIATYVHTLDCVIDYMDSNPIQLEVLIANIGPIATLIDCVCMSRGIPSYFIINGMMGSAYLDEGKYATVVNAYSTSIKEHYFRGLGNVVCLGDPRMDTYALAEKRTINREAPIVTIGASGHSNSDLNSYLAVEFDFLYDVLCALQIIKQRGGRLRILIKVRANGYREQYERFVSEYFPNLVDQVLDNISMNTVLQKTDFYISIASQTLFEASCIGIPCLYYRKDTEIMDPPFDCKSELVTIGTVDDLVSAFEDFRSNNKRYEAFLEKRTMEKYIGPLDGQNLERNLNFIYGLLGANEKKIESHSGEPENSSK